MQLKIITYPFDNSIALPGCILVGGCFDLLHYGHLNFLKASAKLGALVVALESDIAIQLRKGSAPIHTQRQRAEILAELQCVDTVILLPMLKTYEDYLTLVQAVQPAILAITLADPQTDNKKKQAATINAKLVEVNNLIEGLSSTLIKANHL
ncbi:adenylyltransferase/cytidyltransferase family protein [Candidatus Odyssella acanthamoebae]|uniref:adenylyltransferase/cytidyltransferase family protein n=1 Tax=Candidatus Odyssella acanthamoebae TaxID=91604 RepID=UPI00068BFC24|nr:adenylyltransferase/cytidyltransferase family protein [Candidatus Paracaedibacter acanthamoebae]